MNDAAGLVDVENDVASVNTAVTEWAVPGVAEAVNEPVGMTRDPDPADRVTGEPTLLPSTLNWTDPVTGVTAPVALVSVTAAVAVNVSRPYVMFAELRETAVDVG